MILDHSAEVDEPEQLILLQRCAIPGSRHFVEGAILEVLGIEVPDTEDNSVIGDPPHFTWYRPPNCLWFCFATHGYIDDWSRAFAVLDLERFVQNALRSPATAFAVKKHTTWVGVATDQPKWYSDMCRLLWGFYVDDLTYAIVRPCTAEIAELTAEMRAALSAGRFDLVCEGLSSTG